LFALPESGGVVASGGGDWGGTGTRQSRRCRGSEMTGEKRRRGVKVAGVSLDGVRRGLSDGPGKLRRTGAANARGVEVR